MLDFIRSGVLRAKVNSVFGDFEIDVCYARKRPRSARSEPLYGSDKPTWILYST